MTCIVGLKHNDKIYIAGDSLGTDAGSMSKVLRLDEKVFIKDEMIFGFTTSFRMGQILRYALTIPERVEHVTDMEYLVVTFIPAVMSCFEEQGFIKKGDEDESQGGQFLLGYRGQLYNIADDFQVGIPALVYDAIGCGDDLALGSMHTTEQIGKSLTPRKRLTLALDAASDHSAGVAPPYTIKSI